jgi:hypothetical protein
LGKTKNKDHDQVRYLQGEIKRLEKKVRSLEKEVRSHRKMEHAYEISQDEEIMADSEDTHPKMRPCDSDSCGKGFYKEMELMGKTYGTCGVCGFSKRLK